MQPTIGIHRIERVEVEPIHTHARDDGGADLFHARALIFHGEGKAFRLTLYSDLPGALLLPGEKEVKHEQPE